MANGWIEMRGSINAVIAADSPKEAERIMREVMDIALAALVGHSPSAVVSEVVAIGPEVSAQVSQFDLHHTITRHCDCIVPCKQ